MQLVFDIIRNFTAIMVLVVGLRFLAWVGLCGRVYIEGGNPALEAVTHRRADAIEYDIFAGAFLLCTMGLGAIVQPAGFHWQFPVQPNLLGWILLLSSISLMLCWRLTHPNLKIAYPWRIIGSAAAMAVVLGVSKWGL